MLYKAGLISDFRFMAARYRFWLRKHLFARRQVARRKAIELELFTRTPGFASFQEESWQVHCDEPCEFHGPARVSDMRKLTDDGKKRLFSNSSLDEREFQHLLEADGDDELHYYFRFVCRRCSETLAVEDLD